MYNNNKNQIETQYYGTISIRKSHIEGEYLSTIEDCQGNMYDIIRDTTTNQIFAVEQE